MDLGSLVVADDGSDIEKMGEERRERESMAFIRKAEVKSRVSIPTYAISRAQSIVSVLQQSVNRFVVRFFGYILTRSHVQVPVAIAPRRRLLEISYISVKRRGKRTLPS